MCVVQISQWFLSFYSWWTPLIVCSLFQIQPDLVLSLGLPICNVDVLNYGLSDHMPVIFNVIMPCKPALAQSGVFCSRLITTSTAVEFSEMYNSSSFVNVIECPSPSLGPDELLILFNSVCSDILDVVAPYKVRKPKLNPTP